MRTHVFRLLLGAGLFMLALSVGAFSQPFAAQAQPPRPTVPPTSTPIPPTETPIGTPVATPRTGGSSSKTEYGRVTGTVIDQTTGAPVAGVSVVIGEYTVVTDANGNYDFPQVPVGNYTLSLTPSAQQGVAQEPVAVMVTVNETVVQHMTLTSPAAPTVQAPVEPAPVAPAPTAVPMPAELPRTGNGSEQGSLLMMWTGIVLIVAAFAVRRFGAKIN